nr:hypothetical protein [Tessaracoccus coleopterorum]
MSLDFTPRPAAARPAARVWAHARIETAIILRNGEQALLAVVIPLAVLVGARFFGRGLASGCSRARRRSSRSRCGAPVSPRWPSPRASSAGTTCSSGWRPPRSAGRASWRARGSGSP